MPPLNASTGLIRLARIAGTKLVGRHDADETEGVINLGIPLGIVSVDILEGVI